MVDVDWTKPIEAVHRYSREVRSVYPAAVTSGPECVYGGGVDMLGPCGWRKDGTSLLPHYTWTIRNVAPAVPTHKTALECLDAMEALVRRMAGEKLLAADTSPYEWSREARRIVADMEPVVDEDLVEAREIAASGVVEFEFSETLKADILAGKEDHIELVQVARRAIRRGREL